MWRFDIIYSDPFWSQSRSRSHISSVWISHQRLRQHRLISTQYIVADGGTATLATIHCVKIRMHSSRMRTGRSLTVLCRSLLPGGRGVSASGGGRGCLLHGGLLLGGVYSGGGGSPPRGATRGGGGLVSQHALRQTPRGQNHRRL